MINYPDSKDGMNKEEASIDNKIFPVIHEGMNISEVLEGTYHTKRVPDNTKMDKKDHLKKPVDAIWLNYIDGKVFNARDLRHSKYWKDLNTVLKMMVEQRKSSKCSSKSFNQLNDLNNVIIGITINYSNDSEYWEGASVDWLVQGVHEAILAALKDDTNQSITKESTRLQDRIEIEVLRVAKYAVGVPRLFVILSIHQFEKERGIKDCGASKKQNANAIPNAIPKAIPNATPNAIPKTPEVAKWQWHNKWPSMHDLLLNKKVELNPNLNPNPHIPSPSTDRFRRVSPLICGLVKHVVSLKQKFAGCWGSTGAVEYVPQNTELSISRQTNTRILVYEDGFQHLCPSLLKLQKTILSGLQISCCTEDPVQLFFLKEFAKSTECDTERFNVIQLPDKDIKHSKKTTQEEKISSTELMNVSSGNLFINQDGLILLIQGGCKRWKDMFGLYVTNWITDQDRDYRRKLLLQGNLL